MKMQLVMQGASLLMFTVYLQIGAQPISFATAAGVQVELWWINFVGLQENISRSAGFLTDSKHHIFLGQPLICPLSSALWKFLTEMMQVIIPFTLWWWKDLSQEVARDKSFLAQVFEIWRFVATGMFCVHKATHKKLSALLSTRSMWGLWCISIALQGSHRQPLR